ncbi:hypothetical protein AB1Y20_001284 [Prymnesium parvum]
MPLTDTKSRVWVGLCVRCKGCVLHAAHPGECKIGTVDDEEYEMERIVSQRKTRRGMQYLVKWVGWPEEDSTWELERAFTEFDCIETLRAWKESKEAQLKEKRARRTASMPACASATSEAQLSEAAPTHSGQNSKQTQPSTPGQQPPAPGSTQSEQSEVHVALLIGQQPVKSSLKKRKQVTWAQDDGDDAGQKAGSAKSARAKAAKSSAGASQPSPRVNFDAVLMPVPGRARLMTVARFADENDVGLSEVIEIEEPRGALGAWDAPLHGQRAGLIGDAHCSGKSSKANEGEKELHEEGRLDGEARVSASCGATALLPPERWQGNLSGLLA